MTIGETIRTYRKEKGLTQERMAERLGVTAPAVNKWEKNVALPDVTMLAPIARLLGISTDTLLSFRQEPAIEEIDALAEQIDEKLKDQPFGQVFTWVREQLRLYPGSAALRLRLAQFLSARLAFLDLPDQDIYDDEMAGRLSTALESGDDQLTREAAHWLYAFALRRKNYTGAEEYLAYLPESDPQRKRMQADIFARTGREDEAYKALEELLYAERSTLESVFASLYLLAMEQGDHPKARYYDSKRRDLARMFEMGAYHECTGLELAIAEQDLPTALSLIEIMLRDTESIFGFTRSPLFAHMDFRDREEIRLVDELRTDLIASLRQEPPLRDDPGFQALAEKYSPKK